jgi:hypothetical protein
MKCPQCAADTAEGKNFCPDCGALLTPQLVPLVRSQVEQYFRENFTDQTVVDIRTTEAIAERFVRWGKWFLIPATFLLTVLGVTLAILGLRDYEGVHRAAQQAIAEADTATKKAQDAETKSEAATRSIDEATTKMTAQLSSAQQLSSKVNGMESQNASQIAKASKHIEDRVTELDKSVEAANKTVTEQQAKLTSTNELVALMYSKGQVETFYTEQRNSTFAVVPTPQAAGNQQKGAVVYMLLKNAPIYQTLQINFRIYVQPKSSYFLRGNVLVFVWGDPVEGLKQWPLEVSYVPDPTYKGVTYSALSVKDGHVFADAQQIQ